MNDSRTDLENLIVLGRRGQLDAEQLEELEVRLRQRTFHADLYRWGRAFDLEDGVQPGDETLIARAVDGALRRRHAQTGSRRGARWWRHAAWFLAAVVLGSSATALGVAGYFSWRSERAKAAVAPPPAFVPTSLQPTSTKKRRIHPPAATTAAAAASEVVEPIAASDPEPERPSWLVSPTLGTALSAGSAGSPRSSHDAARASTAAFSDETSTSTTAAHGETTGARDVTATPTTAAHGEISTPTTAAHDETTEARDETSTPTTAGHGEISTPTTAAHDETTGARDEISTPTTEAHDEISTSTTAVQLFASANEARRQGATMLCVQRYRQLQQRFPASPEAHLSHVSLGKILQARGQDAAAVREFTDYLRQPGALEEEALVGRAAGLARLGRTQDERECWQRLVARFPGSVYAARARVRLAELAGR